VSSAAAGTFFDFIPLIGVKDKTNQEGGNTMDKESFAQVVLSSTDSLYRVSKAILKNDADCEDAVQEAIAIAFEKLYTLRQEAFAKTWLTRILINECYGILKKREKIMPLLAEPEEDENVYEDYSDLYQALGLLKKEYRLTIVLYYLEGYSMEEIAKIMHVRAGTVKSRLSRGRKSLRRIMEEENAGDDIMLIHNHNFADYRKAGN